MPLPTPIKSGPFPHENESDFQLFVTPWTTQSMEFSRILVILQNTGVGSLSLLQGTFLTQRSNPGLLNYRQILYQLSHKGSPRTLEWVTYLFFNGSSWPRNRTGFFKPTAMQETPVRFLGWEDPLEKGMATHSSILAWRILWSEEFSTWCHKDSDTTERLSLHFTFPWKGERKVSIIPTFLPPGARAAISLCGYFKDFANNPLGLISRSTGCGCPSSGKRTAVYQIILPPHLPEFAQTHNCTFILSSWDRLWAIHISPAMMVQLLSRVWFFATPWTAACQASLSITNSQSLLKLMPIESVMPSNHLILCHPLLLLPSIFPSIRIFSSESVLRIRWPKYWSFSLVFC